MTPRHWLPRAALLAMLLAGRVAFAQLPLQQPQPTAAPDATPPSEQPAPEQPAPEQPDAPAPPQQAEASEPRPGSSTAATPAAAAPAGEVRSGHRLNWTYPRFRWWEYVAAGAVTIGNVSMEIAYQAQPEQSWHTPILLDGPARDLLKADAEGTRIGNYVADYTWYGLQYYVLLDGIITPLVSDRLNADVALQLTLLNWQAVGLTGLLARATHVTIGRTRPSLQGCSDDPNAENRCEFRGASFLSGHAAMATASAALGCMNHRFLPLYGGGVADALVCPVLLTGAATVGVLRVVSDKHWLSDVIAGWALGGLMGFGLPYFLHYGPSAVKVAMQPTPNTAIVPWADQTSGGLRFVGML